MEQLILTGIAIGPLSGASGYALVFALCGLLIVEECGVPLPFAPGDLVLVLCGITVATSHLQLWVAVAAISVSIIAGAFAGRELFAVAGGPTVYRIANFLRIGAALDKMAAALRRSGWAGVLIGRLTPGLRVHTTEAAGVIGMPRTTFALGLVPAAAVYESVFFGLGYWLGPAAWSTIQSYTPKAGPLIVVGFAVIGAIAIARWVYGALEQPLFQYLARRQSVPDSDEPFNTRPRNRPPG